MSPTCKIHTSILILDHIGSSIILSPALTYSERIVFNHTLKRPTQKKSWKKIIFKYMDLYSQQKYSLYHGIYNFKCAYCKQLG